MLKLFNVLTHFIHFFYLFLEHVFCDFVVFVSFNFFLASMPRGTCHCLPSSFARGQQSHHDAAQSQCYPKYSFCLGRTLTGGRICLFEFNVIFCTIMANKNKGAGALAHRLQGWQTVSGYPQPAPNRNVPRETKHHNANNWQIVSRAAQSGKPTFMYRHQLPTSRSGTDL
jgi:hypothetical protein